MVHLRITQLKRTIIFHPESTSTLGFKMLIFPACKPPFEGVFLELFPIRIGSSHGSKMSGFFVQEIRGLLNGPLAKLLDVGRFGIHSLY